VALWCEHSAPAQSSGPVVCAESLRRTPRGHSTGKATPVVVYVWYDNEFGYSSQVVRVAAKMANIQQPTFPSDWTGASAIPAN
jgi:hypothetical protein